MVPGFRTSCVSWYQVFYSSYRVITCHLYAFLCHCTRYLEQIKELGELL